MFLRILIGVGGNILVLYTANRFVPGFSIVDGWQKYLLAALVLSMLNWTVKPILKIVSFPLVMLTLGMFTLIINAVVLWLLDRFFTAITIADKPALFWSTIIISLVNLVIYRKL